jgi:multidrug resistance protein, MATE family
VHELSREVRKLALPAVLHSLLQTLVFVVDRIMLGRHGEASLAAMQIGGTLEWSLWSVFAAFEVGTVARVGRHVGANDRASARNAAWLSLALALALGVVVALSTPMVLALLPWATSRASPEALAEARDYLGVTILASPFVFVGVTSISTLQAGGDTRTPLAIGIVANVVHIGLNRVLILGFGPLAAMGARGAGISTAATFAIEAILGTLALSSRSRPVSLRRSSAAAASTPIGPREEARQLVRVGAPAFVERVFYHAGYIAFALFVARLGTEAMAANQSLISVESICFLSADGFAIAASSLVARRLGAGRPDEAHRAAWIATLYAFVTLTTFGLIAFLLRDLILPLFSDDRSVLGIGRSTIPILAIAQPFMSTALVLAQSLRGAGKTRQALAVSLIGAVLVRVSAVYFFTNVLGLGLAGVWLGSTTDWLVRATVLVTMFRKRRATT